MTIRTDWTRDEIAALFDLPFNDLLFEAQTVHRQNFDPNAVQLSTLLSIKTGGCPEDCGYCSQSASHDTGLKATKLMDVRAVLQAAAQAKDNGSLTLVQPRCDPARRGERQARGIPHVRPAGASPSLAVRRRA